VAESLKLSQGQIDQLIRNAPNLVQQIGDISRRQDAQNTAFGLDMLVRPNEVLNRGKIEPLQARQKQIAQNIKKLEKKGDLNKAQKQRLKTLQGRQQRVGDQISQVRSSDPLADLTNTFAAEFAERDGLISAMRGALGSTAEYGRMQDAFGRGVTAQQTESGQLGDRLMQEAMAKMDQGGRLSPEATRDATQAARAGMASRGMATGNAGLAAELLNRDRYSRQREFENLGFARGVQSEDLGRRQTNTAMRADTDRFNIGLLGQSATAADAERARQLGTQQDIYNFSMSTNPRLMLAGLGSPYANMTQPALGQLGTITGSVQPQYSGGQFSSGGIGGGLMGGAMGAVGGAASGAALGTAIGPGYGTALGAGMGLLGGLTGFMGGSR
jgi:hypothetical protein